MKYIKVHVVKWSGPSKSINAIYGDYGKACKYAEEANKKRGFIHWLFGDEWVVQTFDVK